MGYSTKFKNKNITDEQCVWEFFKYEIQMFCIKFSSEVARSTKPQSTVLETKLKILDSKICYPENPECVSYKKKLETLYQKKNKSTIFRRKCDWYEHWEKLS